MFSALPSSPDFAVLLFQRMKESDEILDLILAESAVKCRHRADAIDNRAADLFVRCGCATRERL